jgi:hypothetical protein
MNIIAIYHLTFLGLMEKNFCRSPVFLELLT